MKKNITIICTIASLVLILDSIGMGYKIMAYSLASYLVPILLLRQYKCLFWW